MDKLTKKFTKQFRKLEKEINNLQNIIDGIKNQEKKEDIIIFWDIENTQVPKNKDAFELVSLVKEYMHIIYPNYNIVIKCYYEEQNLTEKNKELLNDAGCYLHHVPNPRKKKERSDMLIIRDLFDMKENNIVGLISSDGDFLPYLTKLKDKNIELFVITNNKKYDVFLPNVIVWSELCSEL